MVGVGIRQQQADNGGVADSPPSLQKWRIWAKNVAYLDMLINSAFIGFCAAFLTTTSVYFALINDPCLRLLSVGVKEEFVKAGLGGLWVVLLSGILSRCISLWTAIMLLQAAVMAKDKAEAEKSTWLWRALTLGGLLICPVVLAVSGVTLYYIPMDLGFYTFVVSSMTILVWDFIWRIVSLWFVYRFLKEFDVAGVTKKVSIEV